jgi:hypothetical protein
MPSFHWSSALLYTVSWAPSAAVCDPCLAAMGLSSALCCRARRDADLGRAALLSPFQPVMEGLDAMLL